MRCTQVVLVDNKDSFVYNLARYVEELGYPTLVLRNDCSMDQIKQARPTHLIISPGPCGPKQAGSSMAAIEAFYQVCPILGVCLGYQAIAEVFGAKVEKAASVAHGKPTTVQHDQSELFAGIANPFQAARYHSLHVPKESLTPELKLLASNQQGVTMALRHRQYPTFGVQFHPESVLTPNGKLILENFLKMSL